VQARDTRTMQGMQMDNSELSIADIASDVLERLPDRTEEVEEQERVRGQIDRQDRLAKFYRYIGPRLAEARLENYECRHPGQAKLLEALRDYAENMAAKVAVGAGIILFGPSGSGKDHLLSALGRVAIGKYGFRVYWADGMDLMGEVRDRIGGNESEASWVGKLTAPEILYLSDPTPPKGELTTHQSAMLGRVLDRRNRSLKPTWVSMNVRNSGEAESIMGTRLVDRLKDGALAAFCNWPSFRKSILIGGAGG